MVWKTRSMPLPKMGVSYPAQDMVRDNELSVRHFELYPLLRLQKNQEAMSQRTFEIDKRPT